MLNIEKIIDLKYIKDYYITKNTLRTKDKEYQIYAVDLYVNTDLDSLDLKSISEKFDEQDEIVTLIITDGDFGDEELDYIKFGQPLEIKDLVIACKIEEVDLQGKQTKLILDKEDENGVSL